MPKKISLPPGTKIPNHLAIIPDGNRRWAKERGLPTLEGHRKGFKIGIEIAKATRNLGIHTLSFWAFSTENWQRKSSEISYLMNLYHQFIDQYLKEAKKDKVKVVHLGRKDRLEKSLLKKIKKAEEETKNNKNHVFNLALDYGGQDEIIRATNKWYASQIKRSRIEKKNDPGSEVITKDILENFLDTAGQPYPYPDLMIRPSGEFRISGFLLWQTAYCEFYFEKAHFPDLTPEHIKKAIIEYSKRKRRFGGD